MSSFLKYPLFSCIDVVSHSPIGFGHTVCISRSCSPSLVSLTALSTHAYVRNHSTNDVQVIHSLHALQQYALLRAYYKNDSTAAFAIMKLYQLVFLLSALHSCSYLTPWYFTAVAVLRFRILVCWVAWPWVPASSPGMYCFVLARVHLLSNRFLFYTGCDDADWHSAVRECRLSPCSACIRVRGDWHQGLLSCAVL